MSDKKQKHVFGPVASRRLGRSLGVDVVPFKTCTLDCVYCQIGRTEKPTIERQVYVPAEKVLAELKEVLEERARPDAITLSGSGEPTLNIEIGKIIRGIKEISDVPITVLTNSTLLSDPAVRADLMAADIVAPNLDAADYETFKKINRPHPSIDFNATIDGLIKFGEEFKGELLIEVFLAGGINDSTSHVKALAEIASRIPGARCQLNTVTRPPADGDTKQVSPGRLQVLAELFSPPAEVIASFKKRGEASAEIPGPELETKVMEMLSRRPCTADDIASGMGLSRPAVDKLVESLKEKGEIREVSSGEDTYLAPLK